MHHLIVHLSHLVFPFFSTWGLLIIFVLVFLESVPLVGFLVPGALFVIFTGVLVKDGTLHLIPVILAGTAGAWAGDVSMFLLGKYYGYEFLKSHGKFLFLTGPRLEKARMFINTHRVKAVFLNRYGGFTRPVGPFISGASHIPFFEYISLTLASAVTWITIHVVAGIIFGTGVEELSHYIGLIFVAVILLSIFIFYSYRFMNKNHNVFKKYYVYILMFNIVSIFFFSSTLEGILDNEWITRFDQSVYHFLPHIQNHGLTAFMLVVTKLADPTFLVIGSIILIGVMLVRKWWYAALLSVSSLSSGLLLMYIIKALTHVDRPLAPLVDTLYTSFPSGHATMIVIFITLLIWTFEEELRTKAARWSAYAVGTFVVLLVGASRIYLRAHWMSDVIAGYALGIFSVTFFMLFLRGLIWSHSSLLKIFRKNQRAE
jgi:undecaprenyl-diphosphatase